MPEILAILIPAVSAGVGLTELGLQLSGAGQPDFSKLFASPTEPKPSVEDQRAKVAAIANRFPSLQEQLGGALSPEALMSMAGVQAGTPGEPGLARAALERWLGLGDTSGLFAEGGGGGGAGGSTLPTPSPTGTTAGGRTPPSLSMFPDEAVPAFAGLTGGST